MPDKPEPSIDRVIQQHKWEGTVRPQEATEWAWDQAPLPSHDMLVLLAVARQVHLDTINPLPALLDLGRTTVRDAMLDLIERQLLCPTTGGGVHVTLDCNCEA